MITAFTKFKNYHLYLLPVFYSTKLHIAVVDGKNKNKVHASSSLALRIFFWGGWRGEGFGV